MTKHFGIFALIFCVCFNAQAQEPHGYISASADFEISSSSIPNSFTNAFLFSDKINLTEKTRMYNALNSSNKFGADFSQKIEYTDVYDTLLGCRNFGFTALVSNNYHLDMKFSDDLIKLFFSGNKMFEGRNIDFSNSSLNSLQYQVFQFGMVKKIKTEKFSHTFKFAPGIVNGSNFSNLQFNQASLYTAADADFIDLSVDYRFTVSDTSPIFSKGKGLALNLSYRFECFRGNDFLVEISDLGFINWNENTTTTSKDTAIHFEGIYIDDVLNIEGNIFGNANNDSIAQNYLYSGEKTEKITKLPAKLELTYQRKLKKNIVVYARLKKRFNSHYNMNYLAGIQFNPACNFWIRTNLNYGGYAAFRKMDDVLLGIEFQKIFSNKFKLSIGSNSLNGFVFPHSVATQNIYGSFSFLLQ